MMMVNRVEVMRMVMSGVEMMRMAMSKVEVMLMGRVEVKSLIMSTMDVMGMMVSRPEALRKQQIIKFKSLSGGPKPLIKGLVSGTLLLPWMLWKHRNQCIFDGARPLMLSRIAKIKGEVALWARSGARGLRADMGRSLNTFACM
jgi:hypothetical protein